jgi:hypothetical protein
MWFGVFELSLFLYLYGNGSKSRTEKKGSAEDGLMNAQ